MMTTDNIFGNDILSGDLNTSLVPELGTEDTSLGITPSEGSFSDPLNQELSLTKAEIVIDENENTIDNSSSFNNSSSLNSISLFSIDPLTGEANKSQVNNIDLSDTSFAPPQSELELLGGFGDVDGKNDVPLEIKDADGNVVETFSLTGEGQASLYRDEEYQYIFFSGVDETTKVDISSTSNIKFGDYIGDSLRIETAGSIEGGDIVLNEPDETGLVLKSGVESTKQTNSTNTILDGYEIVDLGNVELTDLNNLGQAVGHGSFNGGREKGFFYDGSELNIIDRYDSSRLYALNDSADLVGEHDGFNPFYTRNNQFIEPDPRTAGNAQFEFLRDLNNLGVAVGYLYTFTGDSFALFHQNGRGIMAGEENRAYGINDLNQIIGYNGTTNQSYLYYGGAITQLENLPGNNYSFAHDINNLGQIVGVTSDGNGNTEAFFYENGDMQSIGVETGVGSSQIGSKYFAYDIGINDQSQVVVTSSNSEPFLYQNNELTNLNDLIALEFSEAGWVLNSVKEINNQGQIIGQATFMGMNRGVILNPSLIASPNDDYINIGNISTFGDTVLLQGNEITLTGNAITTAGGEITFSGATTVDGNLTIDSSVIEDEVITGGGDITFTGTVNGSQNLTLKAGTGNILFSDVVGSNATFTNVAVEGAGSVTINKDLAVDGNLSLEVIDDVTTANLSAAGLVNISLGKVGDEVYPSTGNVTTGNINALGIEVLNNGNFTAGNLTTTDGDIDVISLNQLNVGQLTANNGAVDLISGTARITVNGTVQGDNGFIALAQQDIVTNEITSSKDAVILKSSQGAVTVNGTVTAFGDASLAAAGNVTVSAVTSNDEGVALISATGTVNFGGAISSMEDVTVASAQSLTIKQKIKAELGSIALGSTEGSVTVDVPLVTAIGVNIAAKQNVLTRRIRTYGGDVIIDAERGTATIKGKVNSRGGDISISALGRVRTKDIISRSGDVSVISDTGLARTGYIRTDRGNRSGDVYLEAGRDVRVAASVEMNGEQYSIYAGEDGVISVAHQQNKKENKRSQFVIGDITGSGTLNEVYGEYAFLGGDGKSPNPIWAIIKGIIDSLTSPSSPPARPPQVVDINPVTGKPYRNPEERQLNEDLSEEQQNSLRNIINNETYLERVREDQVYNNGRVDERGCFFLELNNGHIADDLPGAVAQLAAQYATHVSGSPNDFLAITGLGTVAFYDGIVRPTGAGYSQVSSLLATGLYPSGIAVVETKFGYTWLNKYIDPQPRPGIPRPSYLSFDNTAPKAYQQQAYDRMVEEIKRHVAVARECGLLYFVSFNRRQAWASGQELFAYTQTSVVNESVNVFRVPAQGQTNL
ncbi:hypothetical protein IQ255_03205 [Pleurocapsales cyanobacterium LEGE 10410]|nr:hypothetical protein [Pleurocapsales cyanobacterium LEGE 10410]